MYLVAEFVEGVGMNELPEADRRVVQKELQQHIETLKSLRSDTPGVPGISDDQLLVAPPRLFNFRWNYHTCWRPRSDVKGDFVFCHGDLGQHNVLVDPKTLKIAAIIDWEFGGFWPEWFEWPFWTRPGGSYAHEGEEDDTERCREWLLANCEAVEQSHLPTLKDKLGSMPSTSEDSEDEGPSEKGRAQGGEETTAQGGKSRRPKRRQSLRRRRRVLGVESRLVSMGMLDDRQKQDRSTDLRPTAPVFYLLKDSGRLMGTSIYPSGSWHFPRKHCTPSES